jgi:hypothetical protein
MTLIIIVVAIVAVVSSCSRMLFVRSRRQAARRG